MKQSGLKFLRCPACGGELEIAGGTNREGELYDGTIRCRSCEAEFPVVRYIPRFVEPENYSKSWGKLWVETGGILRDSFTGIPFHRNVIHGRHDESGQGLKGTSPFGFEWPKDMTGQTLLEIGTGTGNCTELLVESGAEILSVDMSEAVDTLPESLLLHSRLTVVQGDLFTGFIRPDAFERIWMFQVLQHTPVPPETLRAVRGFLESEGELAVTSYGGRFDPWYYKYTKRLDDRRAWRILSVIVPPLVRFKYRARRFFDRLGITGVSRFISKALGFIDPREIWKRTLDGDMDDYLMGEIWNRTRDPKLLMKHVIINTFDAITPTYTNNCKDLGTMERWLADAGFARSEVWGERGVRAKAWR